MNTIPITSYGKTWIKTRAYRKCQYKTLTHPTWKQKKQKLHLKNNNGKTEEKSKNGPKQVNGNKQKLETNRKRPDNVEKNAYHNKTKWNIDVNPWIENKVFQEWLAYSQTDPYQPHTLTASHIQRHCHYHRIFGATEWVPKRSSRVSKGIKGCQGVPRMLGKRRDSIIDLFKVQIEVALLI